MSRPDALVVGGGAIGAACAHALSRRQMTVLLLDAGHEPGTATLAAGGMLAPLVEVHPDDPMSGLFVRARDLYPELAEHLLETTGIDVGLWMEGILQLAYTEEEAIHLKNEIAWQRQQGFNSDWLSLEDLRERAPGISPAAVGALIAPEDGLVEPVPLVHALMESAKKSGATIRRGVRVSGIVTRDDRVVGVETEDGLIEAGNVIVAAGAWSGCLTGLPRPLSVEPIRGQMSALDWPIGEPPSIVYGDGGYVMNRGDEAFVGSTMEHVGFDVAVTESALKTVYDAVERIYPSLDTKNARRTWAGLRPMTPDGRPIVGPDPNAAGLWYATGHGRNGILLAGLTGEIISQLMTGDEEDAGYDLTPIDPSRFWHY